MNISGINKNRVINLPSYLPMVTCIICNEIYLNPVICANCENMFCEACIINYSLKNNNKCFRCLSFEITKTIPK